MAKLMMFSKAPRICDDRRPWVRFFWLIIALAAVWGPAPGRAQAITSKQATFPTPAEAVGALLSAAKGGEVKDLLQVLGPTAREIVSSGDPVADAAARQQFIKAYDDANEIVAEGADRQLLYVGGDKYPFPIPIVRDDNGSWKFDTPAGVDTILTRRIGKNELAVIEVLKAYVVAQKEYASVDRDGKGPQYSRRIVSSAGKKNGLYWADESGRDPSPLGVLIAEAQAAGYVGAKAASKTSHPYHGYFYKILLRQGRSAAGGALDYVINGRMIGGFAMVAVPAKYGSSGIMTFIVNHDGQVFEKDLGAESLRRVSAMGTFNPDSTWQPVKPK